MVVFAARSITVRSSPWRLNFSFEQLRSEDFFRPFGEALDVGVQ
jgi:hypothetical protein